MRRRYCRLMGAALPPVPNACDAGVPMGGIDRGGLKVPIPADAGLGDILLSAVNRSLDAARVPTYRRSV